MFSFSVKMIGRRPYAASVRAQWDLGYRAACENRIARRRQVFDEPPFLPQLRSIDRRVGTRQPSFVVIAPDGRSSAAVQQGVGALSQDRPDLGWIDTRTAAGEKDLVDVSLGERSLPCRNLEDRRLML